MTLDYIFEKVRLELGISEPRKPLIYTGDGGQVRAWNSGGRGLILETGGNFYRVKGVDPDGLLTTEVAKSRKNKIADINLAADHAFTGVYSTGEPFGTLLPQKAANEQNVLETLNTKYQAMGIRPPYEFDETIPVRNGTVQNWYQLARPEDDLRVEELDQLLIEKFSKLNRDELEGRCKDVIKLYGRFNIWAGLAIRLMVDSHLRPTARSFLPQNYVISAVDGGYGLFRADHTSTKHLPDKTEAELFDGLQDEMWNNGHIEGALLRLPTAVLIALEPHVMDAGFVKRGRSMGLADFQIAYSYLGEIKSEFYGHHYSLMRETFIGGFGKAKEPIDESFFRKVLDG